MSESSPHDENPLVLKVSAARVWTGNKPRSRAAQQETGRIPSWLLSHRARARLMKDIDNGQGDQAKHMDDVEKEKVNECLLTDLDASTGQECESRIKRMMTRRACNGLLISLLSVKQTKARSHTVT